MMILLPLSLLALQVHTTHLPLHHDWQHISQQSVNKAGMVDYRGLKAKPQRLDKYLKKLAEVSEQSYQSWTKNERLAFLLNAYNAFTVKIIVENYPLKSIKSIGKKEGDAWRRSWIELPAIATTKISLNDIEHQWIRKKFKEPRIHFALVCAAQSCPRLRQGAYEGKKLERQLAADTKRFMTDPSRNRAGKDPKIVEVSSIFSWFKDDFGDLRAFLAKWFPTLSNPDVAWVEMPYDWDLNTQ